jgi:hypothetical protein
MLPDACSTESVKLPEAKGAWNVTVTEYAVPEPVTPMVNTKALVLATEMSLGPKLATLEVQDAERETTLVLTTTLEPTPPTVKLTKGGAGNRREGEGAQSRIAPQR